MKLLLVDDEYLTREGIIESIPWEELGISQIEQAPNGHRGIEVSRSLKPDIILTDVRMPGMDGVEMAHHLQKMFPDSKIIFMSGYSDKEYLKAAISLKAISYVEKPLDMEELQEAIKKAASLCLEEKKRKQEELFINQRLKASIPLMMNEVALQLINKNADFDQIVNNLALLDMEIASARSFVSVILQLASEPGTATAPQAELRLTAFSVIEQLLIKHKFMGVFAFKDDVHIILHLMMNRESNPQKDVEEFCSDLCQSLYSQVKAAAAVGNFVRDMRSIHESHKNAAIAMQKLFFNYQNCVVWYSDNRSTSFRADEATVGSFADILEQESKVQAELLIKRISIQISKYENTPVNYVKGIYYRLLLQLESFMKERGLGECSEENREEFLWFYISKINTLAELENYLLEKVNTAFALLAEKSKNSSTVSMIIKYINSNYANDQLSIKMISDNIGLSLAYICTLFKEETGKTINQYITDYRIGKTKELLRDKVLKVNDIAARVGYCDGNYLAKTFRKTTGISPSEYRERYLS